MTVVADGDVRLARLESGGGLALQARGAVQTRDGVSLKVSASLLGDRLAVYGGWISQGALTSQASGGIALNSGMQAG